MKITFLGTGAADWKIDRHRDMDGFRRNSSLLIDDCLLIDPGPAVPDALSTFGKQASSIKYVINTHRHRDHYCEDTLTYLADAQFFPLSDGDVRQIGKYTVSAFGANHFTCADTVHFIISDGEKRLFYGLDGAWLMPDEVGAIKKDGVDMAILDATVGWNAGDYRVFEHNDLNMVLLIKAALCAHAKRFCISHMARTLHTSHAELCESMSEHGIEVAFDGYDTEL